MLSLTFLLLLSASPQAIEVDPGIRELEVCPIETIAFPTETDGWVADSCGHIFNSNDRGTSWTENLKLERTMAPTAPGTGGGRPFVTRFIWFDRENAVALPYIDQRQRPRAYRTRDGGASWSEIAFPGTAWFYATERVDEVAYACGSSGKIFSTTDSGVTWAERATPFAGATDAADSRCMALSFWDAQHGFAAGSDGTLWRTDNGAKSWEPVSTPLNVNSQPFSGFVLQDAAFLSGNVGWVLAAGSKVFRTQDGGKHWEMATLPSTSPRPWSPGPRRHPIVVLNHPTGIETAIPALDNTVVPWGARGVVTGKGRSSLAFYEEGKRVRSGPLTSPGTGEHVILDGTGELSSGLLWGWSGTALFVTRDDGARWLHRGDLPARPRRIVFLNDERVLARAQESGVLFRSTNGGRTWTESFDAVDALDYGKAAGEATEVTSADSPRCALESQSSSVVLRFGVQGCFGGESSRLKVELEPDAARISRLEGDADPAPVGPVAKVVPREVALKLMSDIVDAALRPEKAAGCTSTNHVRASLDWSCAGQSRHASFETNDCMGNPLVGLVGAATESGRPDSDAYARAIGLYEVGSRATKLLRQTSAAAQ